MAKPSFDELHQIEPREQAGAKTTARYRFQTNLAIVEICDLIESGLNEFALLVEHLDDITIIYGEPEPKLVFIQAKAKASGSWTVSALTKSEDKKRAHSSIIGKLYSSAHILSEHTDALIFISNAPYSIKMANGKKCSSEVTEILASEMHTEEVLKVEGCLDTDFPNPRSPNCVELLKLKRTNLSHADPDAYVVGRIAKLLESQGTHDGAVTALYKTLFHELMEKSAKVEQYASRDQLIAEKGISSSEFKDLLNRSRAKKRFASAKFLLETDLRENGLGSLERAKIFTLCNAFIANRARGEITECSIAEHASRAISSKPSLLTQSQSIFEASQNVAAEILRQFAFDEDAVLAGALVVVSETYDV